MEHIKIKIDFVSVEEKAMPRGREFLVLCCTPEHADTGLDLGHAFIEKEPDAGPEGMVWHPSMSWNYDECEDTTITHWAEVPQIELKCSP